jgi:hypothetical protein
MSELKVSKQEVVKLYNEGNGNTKAVLECVFGKEIFEFDYKTITSLEKACERLGISTEIPAQRANVKYSTNAVKSALSLYKILVIQEAVNNGWKQGEDDIAWYPYWIFYSQKELDKMGEKRQEEIGIKLLSAVRAGHAENAGVRGANATYRGAYTSASYGFPLCFKNSEMAIWVANQFEDLFFDYYGITIKEKEDLNEFVSVQNKL